MQSVTGGLEELLQGARRRVLHLLVAFALLTAFVSSEVLSVACQAACGPPPLLWISGCAALAVLGNLWYRARLRSIEILLDTVRRGAAIRHVEVSHLRLLFVPVGSEVDMEVTDATGVHHLAFGFWTRAAAERLIVHLAPLIAGRPPAVRTAVPPARVISRRGPKDDDQAR